MLVDLVHLQILRDIMLSIIQELQEREGKSCPQQQHVLQRCLQIRNGTHPYKCHNWAEQKRMLTGFEHIHVLTTFGFGMCPELALWSHLSTTATQNHIYTSPLRNVYCDAVNLPSWTNMAGTCYIGAEIKSKHFWHKSHQISANASCGSSSM